MGSLTFCIGNQQLYIRVNGGFKDIKVFVEINFLLKFFFFLKNKS